MIIRSGYFQAATALFLGLLLPMSAQAQIFDDDYIDRSSVSVTAQLGLQSDRIFRGQNLYNGTSVQPQPRIALNTDAGSFYFHLFSHIGADQGNPRSAHGGAFEATDPQGTITPVAAVTPSFNEADFTLGYENTFEFVQIDAGHRWYTYDVNQQFDTYQWAVARLQNTSEFFGTADLDVIAHPHFSVAYDYDAHDGLYYETGVRQPIPLTESPDQMLLIPFAKFGFSSQLNNGDTPLYADNGLAFVDFGLNSLFRVTKELSIQPIIHYNEGVDDFTNSEFSFGVNIVGELGY